MTGAKAQKSVNQHWVPQFYLREFSTPESRDRERPQVWIFSKNRADGDERLTNVRNVCAKRYLYSPKNGQGDRDWEMDVDLQDVESLLSQIWKPLTNQYFDLSSPVFRKALSLFIATTHVRHPDNLTATKAIHQHIVNSASLLPKKADGTPAASSLMIAGKEYQLDTSDWNSYNAWTEDDHHRFFVQTIRDQSGYLAKLMLNKRWSILFTEEELLITSDRPVSIRHRTLDKFGVGTLGTIICFPLSPCRLLVMDDEHREPANQFYPLPSHEVGAFNYLTWNAGSRFMITGRSVLEVLSEIVKCSAEYERSKQSARFPR